VRVLLDTNIVLDVLLERQPFVEDAKKLWEAVDESQLTAYLAASIITDVFYIVRKQVGLEKAHKAVEICLNTFELCAVDGRAIRLAATLPGSDFEDNVSIACALASSLDGIVTRDKASFQTTAIAIMGPAELLSRLAASSGGAPGFPAPQSQT
jgi:predicted nucleic acid-binding protein